MSSVQRGGNSLGRIFRVPLVLALVTAFGLLSALLGDDIWDVLSWLTMVVPLAVIGYYWMRKR
ncbi:MAG: hypothetical protein J0I77_21680 [Rudaea sp.]|uniref:hypothetical protein n=1 Tax=unclassified Rudaea TaxID=2627037 RepID=UPI001AD54F09|nr:MULTISPECIES: hypothetical protein [unclassified Rudaea]MBN8888337.1 hypothetical protein [Rudaea sp.]MBR0346875.1 hypothetical protein [Rudaea sp.]